MSMTDARVSPFDTLERAYDFIGLLSEAVGEEVASHLLLNDLRMLKRLLVGDGRGEES
jgi:hypothetical protein